MDLTRVLSQYSERSIPCPALLFFILRDSVAMVAHCYERKLHHVRIVSLLVTSEEWLIATVVASYLDGHVSGHVSMYGHYRCMSSPYKQFVALKKHDA